MARVSIYVSDELKAQMVELGDQLNWSDVSRSAFEKAISALKNRKVSTMSAIERLGQSKLNFYASVSVSAADEGLKWATERASYFELRELSKLDLAPYADDSDGVLAAVYRKIEDTRAVNYELWLESTFGDTEITEDWGYYFAKAAQDFYNEVKNRL